MRSSHHESLVIFSVILLVHIPAATTPSSNTTIDSPSNSTPTNSLNTSSTPFLETEFSSVTTATAFSTTDSSILSTATTQTTTQRSGYNLNPLREAPPTQRLKVNILEEYQKRKYICPKNFRLHDNGICYWRGTITDMSARDGKFTCAKINGFLPEPYSAEENNALFNNFVSGQHAIPLGIDDEKEEKTFKYQVKYKKEKALRFSHFEMDASGNSEVNDCVYMEADSYWTANKCGEKKAFGLVCQAECCPTPGSVRAYSDYYMWMPAYMFMIVALTTVTVIGVFFKFNQDVKFTKFGVRGISGSKFQSRKGSRGRSSLRSRRSKTSDVLFTLSDLPSFSSSKRSSFKSTRQPSHDSHKKAVGVDLGEVSMVSMAAKNRPSPQGVLEENAKIKEEMYQTKVNDQANRSPNPGSSNSGSDSSYSESEI